MIYFDSDIFKIVQMFEVNKMIEYIKQDIVQIFKIQVLSWFLSEVFVFNFYFEIK